MLAFYYLMFQFVTELILKTICCRIKILRNNIQLTVRLRLYVRKLYQILRETHAEAEGENYLVGKNSHAGRCYL